MKQNETQLSLNINEKLLKEFKATFEEDEEYEFMYDFFKEKLRDFFIEMQIDIDNHEYSTKPMSIIIPNNYKKRMIEIKRSDNEFYSMKEIIEYIMKSYNTSKK